MNSFAKGMLMVLIILWVVSPIDAFPGPIDDILVIAFGMAANKSLTTKS